VRKTLAEGEIEPHAKGREKLDGRPTEKKMEKHRRTGEEPPVMETKPGPTRPELWKVGLRGGGAGEGSERGERTAEYPPSR